jgi:hypothetical protein
MLWFPATMAYIPLALDSQTPPHVAGLIQSIENHFFRDVHTMLRLPLPHEGLSAGCNFAIAQVLVAVVSGVSVTLYSHTGKNGGRFKALLRDFYPWSRERTNTVKPKNGAKYIYSLIRNPLTHDLGLDLENRSKVGKVAINRLHLANTPPGLSESVVEQIERDPTRVTPSPTLTVTTTTKETVLQVEMFYGGVRTMIENLTRDRSRMQAAETFLASI